MKCLPVLNYHSVSSDPSWRRPLPARLSVHPVFFEWQLDYLRRKGYLAVSLSEAHELLAGERPWPAAGRAVALTFDDGYADNWTAAFPRLQARGMKATFFVSTDFVSSDNGRVRSANDAEPGYMNRAEVRAAADSGLVEIQSHGVRHERLFTGDRLRGAFTGARRDVPVQWMLRTEEKIHWWRRFPDPSLIGHPLFANGTGLNHLEYRPDPAAVSAFTSWFREQPSERLRGPGAVRRMRRCWASLSHTAAYRETHADYIGRVERELRHAREILEAWCDRPVRYFCWPENEFNACAIRLAHRAGYRATVSNRHPRLNLPGRAPDRIGRRWVGERILGMHSPAADRWVFAQMLEAASGNRRGAPLLKGVAAFRKLTVCLQGGPA